MFKKIAFCFIIISLISFSKLNNFRELVLEKLADYFNDFPEKIYVHTDKPYYTIGDDIWYNAYLVNGITHTKSNKSSTIYVELINEQDSIVSKKQLYVNDFGAPGDIKINKKWPSGNYILRAYTNYMRNDDADYFFQKHIRILGIEKTDHFDFSVNTFKESSSIPNQITDVPEVGFYPESGYLVNGIRCKVAVKIKDAYYQNIPVNGVIKDSDHNIISQFKTHQYGLGFFSLNPEANKTYYAVININNQEIKYPLPKALPIGYNLKIENNGNQVTLQVSANHPVGLKSTFLVGHLRGSLIYEKFENESKNSYTIKINTKNLSSGIANFTLFDSNGNPVCERLVYIDNPESNVSVQVDINNKYPKKRDKVALKIGLKDFEGNTTSGNLSMSVTDMNLIENDSKSENIKTYLLLNSDLRGTIENPGYFFEEGETLKKRYLLDLLMLTHGWRRFIWNDILYNTTVKKETFKPEKGIYVSGYTTDLKDRTKRIATSTRITFVKNIPYQETQKSNSNGMFKFGPYVFNDTLPALLEARTQDFKSKEDKSRFVSIYLDKNSHTSPAINHNKILKTNIQDSIKIRNLIKHATGISEIDEAFSKSGRLLDEVVITAKRKTTEEKREDELNKRTNHGFPTHRLDINDIIGAEAFTVLDLLRRLPGIQVTGDSISIRNGGTPLIILDGFPVQLDDVSFLTGFDIEFIDVLSGANAIAYSNSANGVIAIYTKTGSFNNDKVKREPGIIDFKVEGFYAAREFYSPDHLKNSDEAYKTDLRTTLYWNPEISILENTAEISFFTSDSKGRYAIQIQGITKTGIPVYHVSTFEVD